MARNVPRIQFHIPRHQCRFDIGDLCLFHRSSSTSRLFEYPHPFYYPVPWEMVVDGDTLFELIEVGRSECTTRTKPGGQAVADGVVDGRRRGWGLL